MYAEEKNNILIVDDEQSNIIALTHILSSEYTLYAVKDGQDALELAQDFLPDLILLDIVMPDMDGYEVMARLKGNEKTRLIPVIFITGLSDVGDEEKGLALGAEDYISKPFSEAIVKLRVQNQIRLVNQTRLIIEKETAEKSSRQRSEFLSRMSHEMRTPMNAIMGMTALAKNVMESEKRNDMLDKISNASGHLLSIIDDVLDMSDIEDNKLLLQNADFSFNVMMRNILNRMDEYVREKQQALTTMLDPSIPEMLVGDEKRLSQVLLHLLSNAAKFTPEQGAIQINAHVLEVDGETLTIQMEVIDNGIGIAPEMKNRLFIPFEQGKGGIDRKYGGTGLGLAISKHIVELMDGEIWVESELGKGAKFIFTMKAQLKALKPSEEGPVSYEGKTALLVEDIEINREIVLAMLEDSGLQIHTAENGRQAVDLFAANPGRFHVILMDINMPEMDGVEATKQIRAIEKVSGTSVPIIAMTANVLMSEVNTYFAAGMNDHIGKPLDFDKLNNKLNKYLR
jgi:Signal transduction histidine kinase